MDGSPFNQSGDLEYAFGFVNGTTGAVITEVTGIANEIGVSPTSLSINYTPEFEADAQDPAGVTVSNVIGPRRGEFTMEGYLTCEAKLNANTYFWFDDKLFTVSSREVSYQNQDYQQASLSGTTFENISHYCVGTYDAAVPAVDLALPAYQIKGHAYLVTVAGTPAAAVGGTAGSQAMLPGDVIRWNNTSSQWDWIQHPCNAGY